MKRAIYATTATITYLLTGCGGGGDPAALLTEASPRSVLLSHLNGIGDIYNDTVQQLYVAYFGRPADVNGLADFKSQLSSLGGPADIQAMDAAYNNNDSIRRLIDSFGTSAESNSLYGGDTNNFVTSIYRNVLNRAPDPDGFKFWVDAINAGVLTKPRASFSIMAAALVNSTEQGLIDARLVRNKISVASSFTHEITDPGIYNGDADAQIARNMLSSVTDATDVNAFRATIISTIGTITQTPLSQPPVTTPPPATEPPPATTPPPATEPPPAMTPPPATEPPLATTPPPATEPPPATTPPPVTETPPATEPLMTTVFPGY